MFPTERKSNSLTVTCQITCKQQRSGRWLEKIWLVWKSKIIIIARISEMSNIHTCAAAAKTSQRCPQIPGVAFNSNNLSEWRDSIFNLYISSQASAEVTPSVPPKSTSHHSPKQGHPGVSTRPGSFQRPTQTTTPGQRQPQSRQLGPPNRGSADLKKPFQNRSSAAQFHHTGMPRHQCSSPETQPQNLQAKALSQNCCRLGPFGRNHQSFKKTRARALKHPPHIIQKPSELFLRSHFWTLRSGSHSGSHFPNFVLFKYTLMWEGGGGGRGTPRYRFLLPISQRV